MKIVKADVQNPHKNDYRKIILEFLDSGLEVAEVIELSVNPYAARSSFYGLIERRGMGSMVKASVNNGRLYLIRKNGGDQ